MVPVPAAIVIFPVLIPSASSAWSNVMLPLLVVNVVVPPVVANLTAESNSRYLLPVARVKLLLNTVWPEELVRKFRFKFLIEVAPTLPTRIEPVMSSLPRITLPPVVTKFARVAPRFSSVAPAALLSAMFLVRVLGAI